MNSRLLGCLVFGLLLLAACSSEEAPRTVNYLDEGITRFTQLGFLGAAGHGATQSIEVKEGATVQHPGGLVLRELENPSLLGTAGLQVGDVIVKAAGDFLPDKEDPSLDLLKRLESAITAGKTEIPIGYLRKGALQTASLAIDPQQLPPLNPGAIGRCERSALAAKQGLAYLQSRQLEDGSFPMDAESPDGKLAIASMAGLAFLAGGEPYEAHLEKCLAYIKDKIKAEETGYMGVAYAILFLAEYSTGGQDFEIMGTLAQGLGKLMEGAAENGSWALPGAGEDLGYCEKSLATACCIHALGTVDRSGVMMSGDNPFAEACAFLKEKTNDGDVGYLPDPGFDKRSEAGRLAQILVALRSLSCPFSDPYMQKLLDYVEANHQGIARAPLCEARPLFDTALLARQKGLPEWARFTQDYLVLILSLQKGDGSFAALPKTDTRKIPFYDDLEGPAWRTALYSIVLLLQEDTLPLLTVADGPVKRDSNGLAKEGGDSALDIMEIPEGAQTMTFTSMEEAQEFLDSMGIDINDMNSGDGEGTMIFQTIGGPEDEEDEEDDG